MATLAHPGQVLWNGEWIPTWDGSPEETEEAMAKMLKAMGGDSCKVYTHCVQPEPPAGVSP